MLESRSGDILKAIVREFISTGEPVSSGHLFNRYDFGIKPAMIRFEMNELADAGYLNQSHHSSGRTPTDKGYEFFISEILREEERDTRIVNRRFQEFMMQEAWNELLLQMSRDLGILGVARDVTEDRVYKNGLDALIENLEWDSRDEIRSVIKDFEEIDERLSKVKATEDQEDFLKIFVGEKSPVTKSNCLSVITGDYEVNGRRIILIGIGPKRMDYEKSAKMFKTIKKATNNKT